MLRKILILAAMVLLIGSYTYGSASVKKWGTELDNWQEEGASVITDSPVYANGVRLSAWEFGEGDSYQFAIAHVQYIVAVPSWARSADISVAYSGNDDKWGAGVAGMLWIQYANSSEGDSFELPEEKKSHSIRLSVSDYDDNGWMVIRVVVEGSQKIDLNFINVRFHDSVYQTRIVTRHYTKYVWKPWSRYTYWYHYPGRHLHWDPYLRCWVRYTYPHYSRYWVSRHNHYNSYLRGYYNGRRDESRWMRRNGGRGHIDKWSSAHTAARRSYRSGNGRRSRENVRSVLSRHKRKRAGVQTIARAPGRGGGRTTTRETMTKRQRGSSTSREQVLEWAEEKRGGTSAAPGKSGGRVGRIIAPSPEDTTGKRGSGSSVRIGTNTGTGTGSGSGGKRRATNPRVRSDSGSGSSSDRRTSQDIQRIPDGRSSSATTSSSNTTKRRSESPGRTRITERSSTIQERRTPERQVHDDQDEKPTKRRSSNSGRGGRGSGRGGRFTPRR